MDSKIPPAVPSSMQAPPPSPSSATDSNTHLYFIIFFLVLLLIVILGSSLIPEVWNFIVNIFSSVFTLIRNVLASLGIQFGEIVNVSSDVATATTIGGVQIANDVVHDIGNLFKGNANTTATAINTSPVSNYLNANPNPTPASNPIQQPITTNKQSWCLVGDFQGRRGCITVYNANQCMSGQIFPSQQQCLQTGGS